MTSDCFPHHISSVQCRLLCVHFIVHQPQTPTKNKYTDENCYMSMHITQYNENALKLNKHTILLLLEINRKTEQNNKGKINVNTGIGNEA